MLSYFNGMLGSVRQVQTRYFVLKVSTLAWPHHCAKKRGPINIV